MPVLKAPSRARWARQVLGLALGYTVAGKIGLHWASVHASVTAVWPPAGLALGALLIRGYRLWPGVLLGAFLVNVTTAGNAATSLGIAIGNTLEALAGAYLVNQFAQGRKAFDSPYGIVKYAVMGAMGSTIIGATIGATTLALGGFARWADYSPIWTTWWMGDAGGDLIAGPLLALWRADRRQRWDLRKAAEAGALVLSVGLLGGLMFGGGLPAVFQQYPLEFLCMPLVVWAAFRFGRFETALAAFLLSVIAVWGTVRGLGPFARGPQNISLLCLQVYMGVLCMTGLSVAAVVAERRRASEESLRISEARFSRLIDSNVIGIISIDAAGRIEQANEAFLKLIGYAPEDVQAGRLSLGALIPPEYRAQDTWAMEQFQTRGMCPALEKEFVHRQGSRLPVLFGGVRLDILPLRMVCFVIDASVRRQALQALQKAYDEMEIRVEERTAELSRANAALSQEVALRRHVEEELRTLSLSDSLTGLYNRRGFLALAEQQWLQALRSKRSLLFFFADVDGLKQINDARGHACGDQAIAGCAEALRRTFRKSDILARVGGDEFGVVVLESLETADAYRARLRKHLDELNAGGRLPFTLSVSLGAAAFDQMETTSIHELMKRADRDLYAHKHSPEGEGISSRKTSQTEGGPR